MTQVLLAAVLAASPASAQTAPPPLVYDSVIEPGELLRDAVADDPDADLAFIGRPGWAATKSSLLLYDSSGTLSNEVGLGRWEEDGADGTIRRRVVRGGASRDGRFAWSWEAAETVKRGRTDKVLSSARLFRYLGTQGQELFRNELADAPKGLEPAALSDNGERVMLAERGPDAWIAAAYDFIGNRLIDAHGKGSIELMALSPAGAFGVVRWHQLDQPPVYTLLDLEKRKSREASPAKPPLTALKVADDGRVLAGERLLFTIR